MGGAAVVTHRLMEALRRQGVDARMIVFSPSTDDTDYVSTYSTNFRRGIKFLTERAVIYANNGFNRENLFKVSIANVGMPLHKHPWVKEADIIALNWINQGTLSLKEIERISKMGKPIVWTMHDMWCMTGICHHAFECERYAGNCGSCRFLGCRKENDLSRITWNKKKKLYNRIPIHWVPVSNWLADRCRASSLLGNQDITVIHNAFPTESFFTHPTVPADQLGIPADHDLILFGAARIDDPIKGINYAIDALNYIFDNNPSLANKTTAVLFGNIRDRSILDRLRFNYIYLGRVTDSLQLRQLYASAKVVLSTSLYETLPGTLIEGQAAGCLPVTFGTGGQKDIIDHLSNGYISVYKDYEDVARGIEWALSQDVDREKLHDSVNERFGATNIACRYIDLFNKLLSK